MGSAAATLTRPRGERNEDDDDDERNHESRRDGDATATRSMPARALSDAKRRETTPATARRTALLPTLERARIEVRWWGVQDSNL